MSKPTEDNNNNVLKELAFKYYNTLESIVQDIASKCLSGDDFRFEFKSGTMLIIIK